MSKSKVRVVTVIAVLLVVFSVIVFVLPFEKNSIFWLSYLFGILAIVVQLYILKISFGKEKSVKSKFYGFPIAQVGIVYLAVQIAASILFICLASLVPIQIPVILYVILLAAVVLGFVATDAVRDEIDRQDKQLAKNVSCMQELRSKAASLPALCEDVETKKLLIDLSDKFKYSDPVSSPVVEEAEKEIAVIMSELQGAVIENDTTCIKGLCQKASMSLDERNRICKLSK
ncbi:MAG: hypothetical protein K2I22_03510 [Lachnospiraceae bacterium]|nr:hypothetical protein [Lachnospiraceae bacterium]